MAEKNQIFWGFSPCVTVVVHENSRGMFHIRSSISRMTRHPKHLLRFFCMTGSLPTKNTETSGGIWMSFNQKNPDPSKMASF